MDSEKELTQTFEQLKEDLMKHHESVYDDEVEVHSLRRKLRNQEQKRKVLLRFGDQLKLMKIKNGQRNIMILILKKNHLVLK